MKSAEVSAGVEILSSLYLFWKASVSFRPERLAAGSWAMEFPYRSLLGVFCDFAFWKRFLIRDNQDQLVKPRQRLLSRRNAGELP
jgi:hypothetical protein